MKHHIGRLLAHPINRRCHNCIRRDALGKVHLLKPLRARPVIAESQTDVKSEIPKGDVDSELGRPEQKPRRKS